MKNIIQLLPETIANQIAAGEVVQRPASVVKELLENSIDAGATRVQLLVKEAGKTLIQVIDDGKGMSEADAVLCFARHATSKIRKAEDLFSLRTFGFRGEAMASIAAVAQVELRTRAHDEELGVLIQIEGGEFKLNEAMSCPAGTNILVKNLFFNIPARRSFLKGNAWELKLVTEEFVRVALANPQVSFLMYQNDMEVQNLRAGKLSQRIVELFGKGYRENLAPCQEDTDFVKVHGYVGKPENARKTRGEQFMFVNNRFIKSGYLHNVIVQCYQGLIPADAHPFYVLFIDIDPKEIDVNVHPTKTEIKFANERAVGALLSAAVRRSLAEANFTPSLDFDASVSLSILQSWQTKSTPLDNIPAPDRPQTVTMGSRAGSNWQPDAREQHNQRHWERLYQGLATPGGSPLEAQSVPASQNNGTWVVGSQAGQRSDDTPEGNRFVVQLDGRFILTQVKSGLLIIDQQAAHERILYERFLASAERSRGGSQSLLFPLSIDLSAADMALVMELQPAFAQFDIQFEPFGPQTVIVRGLPQDLPAGEERPTFEAVLEALKQDRQGAKLGHQETMARTLARRAAVRPGKRLAEQEMHQLIDSLFATSLPHYTPSGQATLTILRSDKIAELLLRVNSQV